jgi:hypothetical protein
MNVGKKGLEVLAVVGTTMSRGFLGHWGPVSHKRGEVYKNKGTGLGVVDEGSTL